ncbi:MAG: KpsF/GutQ family sugar-phosphate isomerase [candidate division Zixibacteria bacterium]|nr:KpsF/GutQ family sugar-phosphate isomerase [candidate division Zixibacteria bacterium]
MESPLGDRSRRCRIARDVIVCEADAVAALADRLDHRFDAAVGLLLRLKGRCIVTGIGKSGLIGQKIAATLSSTGTPAFFLHPAEAGHGDLGVVGDGDVVLAISKSGAGDEIGDLLPAFKRLNTPIILITGKTDGELARRADIVLDASVTSEAEPNDLVPTCSTTAALALGDALAVTLLSERGFTPEQFARLHPKGALGRRLLLTVGDLMHTGDQVPLVTEDASFRDVLVEMTRKRLGTAGVVDNGGRLIGIFTDGDLRRQTEIRTDLFSLTASDLMTRNPKTIESSELVVSAVARMEDHKITTLFVVDDECYPRGIIHLHDILSTGTV